MVFASCQTSGNKEEKMKDLISTYLTFNESVSYDGEYYDSNDMQIIEIDSLFDDSESDTTIVDLFVETTKLLEEESKMNDLAKRIAKDNDYSLNLLDDSTFDDIISDLAIAQILRESKEDMVVKTLSNLSNDYLGWKVKVICRNIKDKGNEDDIYESEKHYIFFIDETCSKVIRCFDLSICNISNISDFIDACVNNSIKRE